MPLFYIWLSLPFAGFSYFLDLLCSTSHSNNVTIYVSTIVRYVICVKQLRYFCQLANYSTRSLCDNDSITMWGRATECRLNYVNMWGMTSTVEHAVGYLRCRLMQCYLRRNKYRKYYRSGIRLGFRSCAGGNLAERFVGHDLCLSVYIPLW